MRLYSINLQVDFTKPRKMPPSPDYKKEWNAVGYFQTFYCTEQSKEKAKKLIYQYFLKNESDPSNCQLKYDRVAWMRTVTKLEELAHGMESGLTQEMFDNRNKIGIWYAGEKSYYVSEEDYYAEAAEEPVEEFDINDEIEAELSEFDDEFWGGYEGQCQACDMHGPVDDLSLCYDCAGKLDRDLIRKRDWEYSASAFGLTKESCEELRNEVIKKYGSKLELISSSKKNKKKKNKTKKQRKKK